MAAGRRGRGGGTVRSRQRRGGGALRGDGALRGSGDGVARSSCPARSGRGDDGGTAVGLCAAGDGLGENRVPYGTGVDNILDVAPLLKASLRRFMLH
uniref:Uncharacterized protein n=1 Tax=Oryza rufipogon TaxID=4529 RepID=A0A0E0PVZ4_ORYRU